MENLMLISEENFISKKWERCTQTYIDYYDDFVKAFGLEIDYNDIWRLGGLGVIDFWINFNKGEDGNIDTRVGILRMSIETDIDYLEKDEEKEEAQRLIDKYELEEDSKGLLIKQVAKVQDFLVYECEELY